MAHNFFDFPALFVQVSARLLGIAHLSRMISLADGTLWR